MLRVGMPYEYHDGYYNFIGMTGRYVSQVWNTHNWTCHKEVLGHGDEIWALAVVGDRLISGSIDR